MSGVARGASSNRGARYVSCYILRDCAIIISEGEGGGMGGAEKLEGGGIT